MCCAERERIDRENQALLRRLQDVRSSIDAEAAREQYELHEHLLANHANSVRVAHACSKQSVQLLQLLLLG